jgi:ribosomal protein S18 acetylase RimI-like enzyme
VIAGIGVWSSFELPETEHMPAHHSAKRRSRLCGVVAVSAPAGGLSQVVIRPAEPEDLPVLGRLGALLVQLHHEFDPARFVAATPRTEHLYAAFLADQLGKPNGVVLVAGMGAEVLGYTYATVEDSDYMMLRGPAGLFHDLVVDPAHRGNGIGQVLLDATLAALKARGAPRVVLSTAERNAGAQRLFARAGFRRTMIEMTHEWDDVAS